MISKKSVYSLTQIVKMPFNQKTPTVKDVTPKMVDMSKYEIEGLFINVTYDDDEYRVINIDDDIITIMKEDKRRTYNYIVK